MLKIAVDVAKLVKEFDATPFGDDPEFSIAVGKGNVTVMLQNVPADQSGHVKNLQEIIEGKDKSFDHLDARVRDLKAEINRLKNTENYWEKFDGTDKALHLLLHAFFPPDRWNFMPYVVALRHRSDKINAIKRVRELTCWGLKESKDFVDGVLAGTIGPPTDTAVYKGYDNITRDWLGNPINDTPGVVINSTIDQANLRATDSLSHDVDKPAEYTVDMPKFLTGAAAGR